MKNIKFRKYVIGPNFPVFIIAESGINHNGSLKIAKKMVDAAKKTGVDCIKFQTHIAEEEMIKTSITPGKISKKTLWNIIKESELSENDEIKLKKYCDKQKILFLSTPFSKKAVDRLEQLRVPAYKIGSGDITWLEMIEKVASKQKPYIMATGASSTDEVDRAVKAALSINPMLALLQCNTNYTASLENFKYIQLNVLKTYRVMYPNMVLGLSDHTPGHATVLGAVALGARMVEKHFTDDVNRVGPDHKFSMDPVTWHEMVDRTRELEMALGAGVKEVEGNEVDTIVVQRRSLRSVAPFKKGHVISVDDFAPLRPCPRDAIQPYELKEIIGKSLIRDLPQGEYLKISDIN